MRYLTGHGDIKQRVRTFRERHLICWRYYYSQKRSRMYRVFIWWSQCDFSDIQWRLKKPAPSPKVRQFNQQNHHGFFDKQLYHFLIVILRYQLIHLRSNWPQYGFKWLEMFEGTNAVVFCVSLTDYDQLRTHGGGPQNKMLESRDFFESVARSSCFEDTPFLLLLTKYDLFADKINRVPLTVCEWFGDFDPCKAHNKSLSVANQAFHCVAAKFKDLYCSITGRKLYVSQIQCWERKSVDEAFRYVREIIAWEEQKDAGIYATSDEDSVCGVGTNSCPL